MLKATLHGWKHILCPMPLPRTPSWALKSKSYERTESDNRTHFRNSLIDTCAKEHGIEWTGTSINFNEKGEDFSHSSPAPAWGPSHRRQSSTNFSNEQAAPAWVSNGVTSPASKPAPAWASLSMGSRVLPGACSIAGFPRGHSLFQASTCSSMEFSTCCNWIPPPPWTSMGCRGTACLTMVFTMGCRGISALVPGAPPPPPSSLTSYVIAEVLPPSLIGLALASDQRSLVASALPPDHGPMTSWKCQSALLHHCSPSDSRKRQHRPSPRSLSVYIRSSSIQTTSVAMPQLVGVPLNVIPSLHCVIARLEEYKFPAWALGLEEAVVSWLTPGQASCWLEVRFLYASR
ncbi:hypothetical protein QYF61_001426, partial [Mycteria americana]